jgi:hypothetical protein
MLLSGVINGATITRNLTSIVIRLNCLEIILDIFLAIE